MWGPGYAQTRASPSASLPGPGLPVSGSLERKLVASLVRLGPASQPVWGPRMDSGCRRIHKAPCLATLALFFPVETLGDSRSVARSSALCPVFHQV